MSVENRPNLHAVGLSTDILEAIEKRKRGEAKKLSMGVIMPAIQDELVAFVNFVDERLDMLVFVDSDLKNLSGEKGEEQNGNDSNRSA